MLICDKPWLGTTFNKPQRRGISIVEIICYKTYLLNCCVSLPGCVLIFVELREFYYLREIFDKDV